MNPTMRDMLNEIHAAGLTTYRVPRYDRLTMVKVIGDAIWVNTDHYTFRENDRRTSFTARSNRVEMYRRVNGRWSREQDFAIPDDTFEPYDEVRYGKVWTGDEHATQKEWERDCYRPGTSDFPLDNYDRVLAGSTHRKMERYW